jgi:adenosylcobinamide kinase/adenosylcobinamide-phosphate guanylyltransferase
MTPADSARPGAAQAPPRDAEAPRGAAGLTLVLGGARSGKSRHAETLLAAAPPPWIYVATAEAGDAEMAARIAEHRRRRDTRWQTVEAPRELAAALSALPADASLLIDCLTLWLSNLLLAGSDVAAEAERLEAALLARRGIVVAVANEVGLGIVPDNALARRFRDAAGQLNQRLARHAARVALLVAGIPLEVKRQP